MSIRTEWRRRLYAAAAVSGVAVIAVLGSVALRPAAPSRIAVRPRSSVSLVPPSTVVAPPTTSRFTTTRYRPTTELTIQRSQRLTALLVAQEAMSLPSRTAAPLSLIAATRPITGERTVLPVLSERTGANGTRWLQVMIPGRPNGRTGWIEGTGTIPSATTWHIVVETAKRTVLVYDSSRVVKTFTAIVGTPSTPTPLGSFFVEEVVQMPPTAPGAPYALALSARSEVYQTFDGGPGQIAIHGLENIGGLLGTAESHGCVRLDSAAMDWLVLHISPGVPVSIIA